MKLKKWFPVIFLLITWYIPRQRAPGGFLENFIILRWITFILIPAVFLLFLPKYVNSKIYVGNILQPIIALFSVVLISAAVNQSSLIPTVFTSLIYLRYPLLFIILLNMNLNENSLRLFLKVFFFLLIIQTPEVFYRYFALGFKGDSISLTLGPWGTFDLGVYMIYATALVISRNLFIQMKIRDIILILCFFLIALFGEIKVFMFFAPVIVCFLIYNIISKKITKRKLYYAFTFISFAIVLFILSVNWYGKLFPTTGTLDSIKDAFISKDVRKIRRISAFFDILKEVEISSSKFFIGWGPGSSLKGGYLVKKGKIFDFPIEYKNQLAETFADLGFAGLITYYWLLFCLYDRFRKHRMIEKDKTYISLNYGLLGMWLFFAILGPFYDLVWRHDSPNYIFFFLSAVLYSRYRQIKNESFVNK